MKCFPAYFLSLRIILLHTSVALLLFVTEKCSFAKVYLDLFTHWPIDEYLSYL
jgi:hypothetical protein